MGPAPDGAEVLRHQERDRYQQGHRHLHPLCPGGGRRMLLPGRLRPALRGQDGRGGWCARRGLRRGDPRHALRPAGGAHRRGGDPGALRLHVHPVLPGAGLQLHLDTGLHKG